MRFDWYAATVREDVGVLEEALAVGLGATPERARGMHGYAEQREFKRDGNVVARMLLGGRNGNPHVWASSDDTDALVPVLRGAWPDLHRVTRADASEDFDNGPGTWERLYGESINLATERGLKIDQAGDWHRGEGRTLYIGSRKSAVFARLYEKGHQLRERFPEHAETFSPHHCRLELQVRPEGHARDVAASAEPEALYGLSDWSRELARRVLDLDVERVHIRERRDPDNERALAAMVRQYGAHLEQLAEREGGWQNAGTWLERRWLRVQAGRSEK